MQNKYVIYWIVISLFIVSACAQIVSPTGGNRDEQNPFVIQTEPGNQTTSFHSDKIKILFNEYIELKNPEKVIVSPPLKEKLNIDYKGKELEIDLKNQTLDTAYTYTINLSGSIADVHEGLTLKNYTYAFTKNSYINKDSIYGKIEDAFTKKACKDYVVGLYETIGFNDSIPFKKNPTYYGLVNDSGEFIIYNLPKKQFHVFCFHDVNKNLKYENNEDYGFLKNPVQIGEEKSILIRSNKPSLYSINKVLDKQKIGSNTYLISVYKAKDPTIQSIGKNNLKYISFLKEGLNEIDTIVVNYEQQVKDSLIEFRIANSDTIGIVNYKSIKNKKPLVVNFNSVIKPEDSVVLTLNYPSKKINSNRISILQDSTIIPFQLKQINPIKYCLLFNKIEGKQYRITVQDSTFMSYEDENNTTKQLDVKTLSSNQTGEIKLNIINTNHTSCLIYLVTNNDKEEVVDLIKNNTSEQISLKYCNPGEFKVKIIVDANKNNTWDQANWFTKTQAEEVYYLREIIGVRVLWEIEQTISIDKSIIN
jgi:hypothetical protein